MIRRSSSRVRVFALLLVLFGAAFLLHASRAGNIGLYLMAAAVPGIMLLLLFLPAGLFPMDRPALSAALPLCGFGLLATAYIAPEDTFSQGMRCIAALFFLALGVVIMHAFRPSLPAAVLPAALGLGMLSCRLWLPSFTFPLAEAGMALLLVAVTAFLSLRLRLPALAASLGGVFLLLLQRNFSAAAAWSLASVLLFWTASDSILWSGLSLGCTGGLFGIFLAVIPPAAESAVSPLLSRLEAMPLLPPEILPEAVSVSETVSSGESLFFLFGEQYGLVFLLCAVLLLTALLIRGASVALHARKSFHASLAFGIVLLFGLRAFFFLGAAADLIPAAPGAFPFLTSSAPDLFTQFFLLGLLSGISARNETDLEEDVRLSMLAH